MDVTIGYVQVGVFLFILLFVILYYSISHQAEEVSIPKSIPVVGIREESFAWVRAAIRSFSKTAEWTSEGYIKYIKANSPFVVASMDRGPVLVLQPAQMKKVYNLSDTRLDTNNTTNATIRTEYTVQDQKVVTDDFHINVVRNQITRNLDVLTQPMVTEIERVFERIWGTSSEWKTISVWYSCLTLIARVANSALCGPPLCRDEKFLQAMQDHSSVMFGGAILINATPKLVRPVTGTLIRLLCKLFYGRALRRCLPFVAKRVDDTRRARETGSNQILPQDGLQWIIDEALTKKDPSEHDPIRLSERLLFTNDVSMHSTSFTFSNLMLNLFSSDPSLGYVEALREECREVLNAAGGTWTRQAVQNLRLVDSAIRESMRISSFSVYGMPRTVYDPNGISIEHGDSNITIPRGTQIVLPVDELHFDKDIYQNPEHFNPFRFVVSEEEPENQGQSHSAQKGKATVTLDDNWLGFGFGRHGCPGRFFAVHEMKLMAAHMLLNYEVDYRKENPKLLSFIWLKLPLNNATLRVRRISASKDL
ncbi:cytochrome P450 [Hypoxylon sp. FL1857]|nr:cytochrome P450 [Hypoxylon sp. FL1857]